MSLEKLLIVSDIHITGQGMMQMRTFRSLKCYVNAKYICGRLLAHSRTCPIYKMQEADYLITERPSVSTFHSFMFSWSDHVRGWSLWSLSGSRAILVPYVKELKEVQRQAFLGC